MREITLLWISYDYAAVSGESWYSDVILDNVVMGRWMGEGSGSW